MNLINYVLNEIKMKIPIEVLQAAINIDETPETINITSLDEKILRKILKKRVFLDANIVGGIETIIPLNGITPSFSEYYYTIYNIPPEYTMNKEIISALSITYLPSYYNQYSVFSGNFSPFNPIHGIATYNPVNAVANRIGTAAASDGPLKNAHLEIVGYNTILVYANYRLLTNYGIRVILENDENFNNIQPRSYKNFSELCVLAVKAYIYNKLIIAINNGYLSGGQELGEFKNIVDSYSEAEEEYNTYLREVWSKVAFMNDTTRYNRFLNSMLAPDL